MKWFRGSRDSVHDKILEHYRGFWPDRSVESVHWTPEHLGTRLPDLHIAKVRPRARGDYWIFATIGAWRATEAEEHGLEFVAAARSEAAGVMAHLGQLAYYHAGPPENRLGVGHTLAIGEPWMPGSPLDAILVSLPYPWGPSLEHCQIGTRHIQVLWLLPIYETERAFARTDGLEALESRFQESAFDFLDPGRASVA